MFKRQAAGELTVPLSLRFGRVLVERAGYSGVTLSLGGEKLCIDVLEPRGCSAVLYSHSHPRHAPGVVPREALAPFLGSVKPGSQVDLGWARVEAVEAYNPWEGAPHPKGFGVGFLVELGGLRVYYAGDTSFVEELSSLPAGLEVAVLPVGGGAVMTPEEAFEAVRTLKPVLTLPVHFDDEKLYWKFKVLAQPYTQVAALKVR
ncbi:MAG: MBL fold metallo-hydrolase [Thermofilum sp.]